MDKIATGISGYEQLRTKVTFELATSRLSVMCYRDKQASIWSGYLRTDVLEIDAESIGQKCFIP